MSDDRRAEAKRLYLEEGRTQREIAEIFGVSTRTIERWADKDGWGQRIKKVIPIKSTRSPDYEPGPRSVRGKIDENKIVDGAIVSLDYLLSRPDLDTRGVGGIATALVKLLEYRRKIQPPTAAELANQAIELGYSPEQFLSALREQWRLQA